MAFDPGAPVGNTSLTHFDVLIIGSGAGGGALAHVLTKNGLKVLVLEAGANWFQGLDGAAAPIPAFAKDELKLNDRRLIHPPKEFQPRTFRHSPADGDRLLAGDVNPLPQTVGGGSIHADLKMPRFMEQDFKMGTLGAGAGFAGTNFADWPIDYPTLEPYYAYAEKVIGVQGTVGANPFEAPRSGPFPMPPGVGMYAALKLAAAATTLGYHPFPYPTAVNSQDYDGRPACVDCGLCSGYGCPSNAKGSSAVTTLRKALLSGNCLLLPQTRVSKLVLSADGTQITGVQAIDPNGNAVTYSAGKYALCASAIEDARLCWMSGSASSPIGNSSGAVGSNLMFHYQTVCVGVFEERIHSYRGRSVTHGIADFRGTPGSAANPLGGIMELTGFTDGPLTNAELMLEALQLYPEPFDGARLKALIRQAPFGDRTAALTMQAEDAPQLTNKVDLDPAYKDIDGLPVARITYQNSQFEIGARDFYKPKMAQIMNAAGAKYVFFKSADDPSISAHIMGTLRFGSDPSASVCDANGRFHDIQNLYCADGGLFPTSSGFNPTMTIIALATWVGANIANPGAPGQAIS